MNHREKRIYLIKHLLAEHTEYQHIQIPVEAKQQKMLLRALMNVRPASPISQNFKNVQDAYLQEAIKDKGIVSDSNFHSGANLWQGDITRLATDGIVNAANSGMTGCYVPNHSCIDNAIHTFAGIELRIKCNQIMQQQNHLEQTGQAKITPSYNLPCQYVIHTVGPVVEEAQPTKLEINELASSYHACLSIAAKSHLTSIAFPCLSTGLFHFPHRLAATIAINEVKHFLQQNSTIKKVIFNVFKDQDKIIYQQLLNEGY